MQFTIGVCVAVSTLLGAGAPKDGVTPNGDAFHGVWQLNNGESDGKALSEAQLKGAKLVIQGDRYTVTLPGAGTVTGTQKLARRTGLTRSTSRTRAARTQARPVLESTSSTETSSAWSLLRPARIGRQNSTPCRAAADGCMFGREGSNSRLRCAFHHELMERRREKLLAALSFDARATRR